MTDICEHGVSYEAFCDPCAHYKAEEWVGYPIFICVGCQKPWPCRKYSPVGGASIVGKPQP